MKIEGKGSIEALDKTRSGKKQTDARCRHWRVCVSLGRDPQRPGKYVKVEKRITGSKDDAITALEALYEECKNAVSRKYPTTTTVRQYAGRYIDYEEKCAAKSKRTIDGLKTRLSYVTDLIGNVYVKDITKSTVEQMYSNLMSVYNADGTMPIYDANGNLVLEKDGTPAKTKRGTRPLSGKSVLGIHKALSGMLREAERDGIFDFSNFKNVRPPKSDTQERTPLSASQVSKLLAKLDPTKHFDLATIMCVTCGLRRSEALALQWGDVVSDCLKISRALEEDGETKSTKSSAGIRTVVMPAPAQKALAAAREYQNEMFEELGIEDVTKHPICWVEPTKTLTPHAFTRWWSRNRATWGFDGVRIHDLRHTYATLLALSGTDLKTMQELLGDSSTEVVLQVYVHANDESKREAARKISQVISA